jgi:hypothetical protein
MKNSKIGSGMVLTFVVLMIAGIGCTNYQIPGKTTPKNNCEICHTDYERLVEVHSPDAAAPASVYGEDPPHYEPYDRVFLGGTGYDAFKASSHYSVGCKGCHNGDSDATEKDLAHSGDFINHPSTVYEDKCATCHESITNNFSTSIHNGTGEKRVVAMRSGLSGASEFDLLPAHQIEGYNNNCAQCHGTCGNCHVVRPPMGGGGLSEGHNFNKTPDMDNVCITCHKSRVGHAYLGVAPGTEPDVHLTENDYDCLSCHDGPELHGNGTPVEQRYAYTELPECETCHPGLEDANSYHTKHYADFTCQVCHSQEYNNCGSCHIHGDGARIPSYMGFKIASNPIPDLKAGYDFALVRRTPAAPDNWAVYGVDEYANFDVLPTYNYTTPHNLLRLTGRTNVGGTGNCSANCHIRDDGGTILNKELYLFQSDLLDWELGASSSITVDGKLPSYWPN